MQLRALTPLVTPAMSEVRKAAHGSSTPADTPQYQKLKARALELQREKEEQLKRELARKAEREKQAAKDEADVRGGISRRRC